MFHITEMILPIDEEHSSHFRDISELAILSTQLKYKMGLHELQILSKTSMGAELAMQYRLKQAN